jgi:hypothetical protein
MISSPTLIVIIFWLRLDFRVIRVLRKGMHFDATYFRDNVFDETDCIGPTGNAEDDLCSLVMHFDSVRSHMARCINIYFGENGMIKAPQLPFSADLAPSDFYLFRKLENVMKQYALANENNLSLGIMGEASKMSCEGFEAFFDEWLLRLDPCVNMNGE